MTKKEFCKSYNITEKQFSGEEEIGGYLDLRSLTSIPEGFNPTVGGYLDLESLTSIPEGFNPTVGGSIDLRSLTSIPEGFNPTVGGYLDLRSLTSIPEGFNPTVGRSIDLKEVSHHIGAIVKMPKLEWQNGKYILVDGIFTEVVSNKSNVFRIRKIAHKEIEYLVTDGNGNYAHGSTLKEAKEDLVYKITNRSKKDYEHLGLSDTLTHAEAIQCYRVVTGACSFGVKDFINNKLCEKRKESYTISEIIELTNGHYGNSCFADFFNDK